MYVDDIHILHPATSGLTRCVVDTKGGRKQSLEQFRQGHSPISVVIQVLLLNNIPNVVILLLAIPRRKGPKFSLQCLITFHLVLVQ